MDNIVVPCFFDSQCIRIGNHQVGHRPAMPHILVMAALCNRTGHYIFALHGSSYLPLLLLPIFFPRLISAVADWIYTILRHMVWPYKCEFRMKVWNVLHVHGLMKIQDAKWRKKSPSGHHPTTCRAISSQLRHVSTIKELVKQQYVFRMSPQYGELRPTSGWDRFGSLGHPSQFQRVSRLAFVLAATSLNGRQPNFARCLAISCAGTLFVYIFGGSFPWQNFVRCKIHFTSKSCILILATLMHGTPAAGLSQTMRRGTRNGITELLQRAPPIFDRAAIPLASAHIL